jgi:hypothetical protein
MGRHSLVYCPGDLIGLSYQLTAIHTVCDLECLCSGNCPHQKENYLISLPYGSVQIPLTIEECRELHLATQETVQRLYRLRNRGYFSNQQWLPPSRKWMERTSQVLYQIGQNDTIFSTRLKTLFKVIFLRIHTPT